MPYNPGQAAVGGVCQVDVGVGSRVCDAIGRNVIVTDIGGVDSALVRAVRPQRVVDGQDQARADPVGRGWDGAAGNYCRCAPMTRVWPMALGELAVIPVLN